jgi:hypothetical protein
MKIILKENQYKLIIESNQKEFDINEKRSHPKTNVDPTFNEFFNNITSKYNIDDIFVSFRDSVNVTDINPKNKYNTPTGFYSYPLKSYKDKLTKDIEENEFRTIFPYQSELDYIYFLVVSDKTGLISSETPTDEINGYVKKIHKLYGNINPVKNLCELFLNDKYKPTYTEPVHNAHKLWLFIFDILPYITKGKKETAYNNLCNKIGIIGFADYYGDKYIHQAEPKQAVFFKVKNIGKIFYYENRERLDGLRKYFEKIHNINFNKIEKIGNIFVLSYDDKFLFLNEKGKPSIEGLDVNKINDSYMRGSYYNQLLGTDKFRYVNMFGEYGDDVTFARLKDGTGFFMNRKGEPSIEGINFDEINRSYIRAAYYNQLLGTDKFRYVNMFGEYDKYGNVAYVQLKDGTDIFINRKGEPSIEGINIDEINNSYIRSVYYNQLLGTDKFSYVEKFGEYGDDVTLALLKDDTGFFMNRKGEPSVEGLDVNKINDSYMRAAYYNQLLGTDKFNYVEEFGEYNDDVAFAKLKDDTEIFINKKGEPSIEGLDVNKINDSYMRAAYYNQLLGTDKFNYVEEFGEYDKYGNVAYVQLKDGTDIFINKKGEPSIEGLDVNKINDSYIRSVYYNQLLGTDKFSYVEKFGEYGDDVTLALLKDDTGFFMNRNGEKVDNDTLTEEVKKVITFNGLNGNELSYGDKIELYDLFKKTYEKSVGTSWGLNKFLRRLENWKLYGDSTGFITVRIQRSGFYKLTGSAGNPKGVYKGFNMLSSLNVPIWGGVTETIAKLLQKKGFIVPNRLLVKVILQIIPKEVFGGAGSITKVLIVNKQYLKKVLNIGLIKGLVKKKYT